MHDLLQGVLSVQLYNCEEKVIGKGSDCKELLTGAGFKIKNALKELGILRQSPDSSFDRIHTFQKNVITGSKHWLFFVLAAFTKSPRPLSIFYGFSTVLSLILSACIYPTSFDTIAEDHCPHI